LLEQQSTAAKVKDVRREIERGEREVPGAVNQCKFAAAPTGQHFREPQEVAHRLRDIADIWDEFSERVAGYATAVVVEVKENSVTCRTLVGEVVERSQPAAIVTHDDIPVLEWRLDRVKHLPVTKLDQRPDLT